jgi:peptide subunit release factor 1 (eRF1)
MGYGVVLIDKQQARIFAFNIGDEQEEVRFNGNEVQRHKHGGGSQVTGRSRGVEGVADDPEQTAQRNMQAVAQKAADFFRKHDVRRVILAGTEKNVSAFQNLLPKSWQSLVVGSFPMNMNAGINEIREAAWQIGYKKERRQERKVVETIVTEAAKGRNGLVRFDEILSAVKEGRVQTLALLDEIHEEGYQCQGCGYITDQELDVCPFCSDRFEHIQDAVEMTVQGVLQSGGNVKMIRESELLEEHGGIGALLRY